MYLRQRQPLPEEIQRRLRRVQFNDVPRTMEVKLLCQQACPQGIEPDIDQADGLLRGAASGAGNAFSMLPKQPRRAFSTPSVENRCLRRPPREASVCRTVRVKIFRASRK